MVCDTLKNSIPKAVVFCQVREAKRSLLNNFYAQVGRREVNFPNPLWLYLNLPFSSLLKDWKIFSEVFIFPSCKWNTYLTIAIQVGWLRHLRGCHGRSAFRSPQKAKKRRKKKAYLKLFRVANNIVLRCTCRRSGLVRCWMRTQHLWKGEQP